MRIWRFSFKDRNIMRTVEIPLYILRQWHSHFRRIAERATCDRSDTRTANALRMAAKDVARLARIIDNNNDNGNEDSKEKG